jgi:hypothetical protein
VNLRRKFLLALTVVSLTALIVVVGRPVASAYAYLLGPTLFAPPQGPDTDYARTGVSRELDLAVLKGAARVYWYADAGRLGHPRWARFDVADTVIPAHIIRRFNLARSPTPNGMPKAPAWFTPSADRLGVRHYANGHRHLWWSEDGKRVWYYLSEKTR